MRVVIDTNVVVSGLISPHGNPAKLIKHWINGDFTLLYSPAMLEELEDVLNRAWLKEKLSNSSNKSVEFLEAVKIFGELVHGYVNVIGAVRDPFDEMFLICAVLGEADLIVTGDRHLLTVGQYKGARIVTPAELLKLLSGQE